jgi:hypothetical protein
MYVLNLIGLVLGYLGSILLSAGLIKSKEEVIDEEKPFWGPNPFRIRSTLRSRQLGFMGVALLVAGFAISTVAAAFENVLHIDSVGFALAVIVALIAFAYGVVLLALRAKKRAHISARNRYYFNELIHEVRELRNQYQKEPFAATADHSFDELKKQHTQMFTKYTPDLDQEGKKQIGKLIGNIDKAETFDDLLNTFDEFLAEHDREN